MGGIPPSPASTKWHSMQTFSSRAMDQVGTRVAGARYHCVACHVPQTKAKPLVANNAPVEKRN